MRALLVCVSLGAVSLAGAVDYLFVPSSSGSAQKIMQFSAFDGSVVNANFIVSGQNGAPTMSTPKHIIDSGRGTLLLSDQAANAVWEFGFDGSFIGTVASSAQGLSNLRGIAVRDGSLYVTLGSGTFNNTVQRFDLNNGNAQSTFISSNLSSPFDVYFRDSDVLVTNSSGTNSITRYDLSGNFLGAFTTQASSAIRFPEEITPDGVGGNILVTGFSSPAGIYSMDSNGNTITTYASGLAHRGAWRLDNGNILFTISTAVGIWDTAANVRGADALSGVNAQFVERITMPVPEPATIAALGLGLAAIARRRRRS
jgi:hypothetical protein